MTKSRLVVVWRWGLGGRQGREREGLQRVMRRLGCDGNTWCLDCGGSLTVYTYVNTYQRLHFKYVRLIVCQLYFPNAVFKNDLPLWTCLDSSRISHNFLSYKLWWSVLCVNWARWWYSIIQSNTNLGVTIKVFCRWD